MMYACAMKEVRTKFEVLNTEFKIRYQRNPIASISTRLKRTASILEKLGRHDLPFSLNSIAEHINDVAGIRVICSYIDDIYTIADALLRQDDVTLIDRKDYMQVAKLTAIMRVANVLDRSHKQKIEEITVSVKEQELIMRVTSKADLTLEKVLLTEAADFFEEIFSIRPVLKRKKQK